jgi:Na+/H+ antiporter NhaC
MKKAERNAAVGPPSLDPAESCSTREAPGRMWYALVPLLVLVGLTVGLLGVTGWSTTQAEAADARAQLDQAAATGTPVPSRVTRAAQVPTGFALVQRVISNSDSFNSILYGALAAIIVAAAISLATRRLTVARCVDAATETMSRMLPTFVVLVLAWSLSGAMGDLRLGEVAAGMLRESRFDPIWLPLLIFVSACVVSFATGTSWGTMGILCPATVTIAASLLSDLPSTQALPLFYAAVGGVLAGAVFGDHCSPISDTTVLSSLASECSLEEHVWTQMPYALTVAGVSIICGDVLCRYFNQSAWVGLAAGTAVLLLIVAAVGRTPPRARAAPATRR